MPLWEYEQTVATNNFTGAKYFYHNDSDSAVWTLDEPASLTEPDTGAGYTYKISTTTPRKITQAETISYNFYEGNTSTKNVKTTNNIRWIDKSHKRYLQFEIQVPLRISVQGYYEVNWTCILNCERGKPSSNGIVGSLSAFGSQVMWSGIPQVDYAISKAGKTLYSFVFRALLKSTEVFIPELKLDLTINWNWAENVVNIFDFFYSGSVNCVKTNVIPAILMPRELPPPNALNATVCTDGEEEKVNSKNGCCFPLKKVYGFFKKKTKEKSRDPEPE